jgi:hypothetical protein
VNGSPRVTDGYVVIIHLVESLSLDRVRDWTVCALYTVGAGMQDNSPPIANYFRQPGTSHITMTIARTEQ